MENYETASNLLDIVLSNTFSRASLFHRLNLTREFLEYQYFKPHENNNLTYLLNEFIDLKRENRDEFTALFAWNAPFFNKFDLKNFYGLLEKIENEARKLPSAILHIPFPEPPYEISKLCDWFRMNVHPKFVIDTRFDRKLIGGCAIDYKGVHYDFSLRYFLEKNKASIKAVIEDYLNKPDELRGKVRASRISPMTSNQNGT